MNNLLFLMNNGVIDYLAVKHDTGQQPARTTDNGRRQHLVLLDGRWCPHHGGGRRQCHLVGADRRDGRYLYDGSDVRIDRQWKQQLLGDGARHDRQPERWLRKLALHAEPQFLWRSNADDDQQRHQR